MEELCLLYALRRADLVGIADQLRDALNEDYTKNADMFDITRATFSQNRHPNATMRALENDLREADLTLLYLLRALTEAGMELTQGLGGLSTPRRFAEMAAEIYQDTEKRAPSAALLAQSLTEIKAEHALKRLNAAIAQMDLII